MQHIIVVDDLAADRRYLAEALSAEDVTVHCFDSGNAFFDALASDPDLARAKVAILDLVLPDSDGIEILKEFARRNLTIPVILVSGMDAKILETAGILGSAWSIDIVATLQKPVRLVEIVEIIAQL